MPTTGPAWSGSSAKDDGRLEYRTKRGGVQVLAAAALLKRLLVLVPP